MPGAPYPPGTGHQPIPTTRKAPDMRLDDSTDLGPNAYAAYGRAVGFRTHDGRPMPMWEALGDTIQNGWRAVAAEIIAYLADAAQEADDQDSTDGQTAAAAAATGGQEPSQGRVVLAGINTLDNNGSPAAPAIITRVWTNGVINVRVQPDSDLPSVRATSLSYVDTVDDLTPGRWTWPPSA
ncbi:hypothetical protein [Actinacidiphila sp. ITFR-21]|uniref:hypothetical protein n=1 Tax=Actinacidiphila sp. ITFR-21 TaxID=3075199 RepID=UPI00288A553E|nr:hypothetical protein [Streptomyces sp. ITFR-21]WNI16629.1 hypothetical protein RLT57_14655 [Streptomyces sp. ITFR-21]